MTLASQGAAHANDSNGEDEHGDAGTGGRRLPALAYTGLITTPNSAHGTTCSISSKNNARRVFFLF